MADPIPQFSYLISELAKRHPNLAYVHAIESRISGNDDIEPFAKMDPLIEAWGNRVFLHAGGYEAESALAVAEENDKTLIVMRRYFISNPDLPRRIQKGIALEPYNRAFFYNAGEAKGYTDYKPAAEINAQA